MNTRTKVSACLIVAVLSLAGTSLARTPTTDSRDEADVKRVEKRWLAAEDDPAELESILADDFIHVLPSGLITKRQQIDYLKSRSAHTPEMNRHFEKLEVRVFGNVAIANGIVAASTRGETQRTVFTDVFVKRNGEWRAVNAQENPMVPQTGSQ